MKSLLSAPALADLAKIAARSLALAFDYDGTLAPIVADRDAAAMRRRTCILFRHVCSLYPCAVISGRARDDVAARLGTAPVRHVVGNHGIEPDARMEQFAQEIAEVRGDLSQALQPLAGVELESKRYSLAIHYRAAPDRLEARRQVDAAVARCARRLRRVPGKLVLNLLPALAPNKGDALLRFWQQAGTEYALYVGDDITDEDVFRLGHSRLISVRIGESVLSSAGYMLPSHRELDRLLAKLLVFRR